MASTIPSILLQGPLSLMFSQCNVVDDGTGVIPCAQFVAPDEVPAMCQMYELGSTVCVEGRLSTFRDVRQVVIRSIKHIDPNQEVLGWLERLSLRQFLQASIEPQI
ncbi:CST complex subunit STN1 [Coemansia sp. RSA 353]|nr:CST complex subunit STN1 [Coemansia sp. RSA 353]